MATEEQIKIALHNYEKHKERMRRYASTHKDKLKENAKKYYHRHKDEPEFIERRRQNAAKNRRKAKEIESLN
jgi:hypothetical protein